MNRRERVRASLDDIVACGVDALNPIQRPAGGHTPREWIKIVALYRAARAVPAP